MTAPAAIFRTFLGDREVRGVAPDDRGLAYGDGLFETMRGHAGRIPWWSAHWDRLARGAERLAIALPARARVEAEMDRLLEGADGVVKLRVGRAGGGRGYAPPAGGEPSWSLSLHAVPEPPRRGLVLRWCATRISIQPALAGIKHCNRLEQVLARLEWHPPGAAGADADEGLMCDTDGAVVSATAANLFVLHGSRWQTPGVDRCGVAGVCRGWLLQHCEVDQARITVEEVERADALVLTNAVRGILPVARLGRRNFVPHPAVAEWQRRLARSYPAFASTPSEMP